MSKLTIGQIFRTARPYSSAPQIVDNYTNHFYATYSSGQNLALLDSGINPMGKVKDKGGQRQPAILIRSTPHKIGSHDTPWQDTFDVDNGHIRYFGDNKDPSSKPDSKKGNKALLEAFKMHSARTSEERVRATPLVFYRAVAINGKQKGFVEFNGFGIIRDVKLVTQYDRTNNRAFTNYVFGFTVFSMSEENEEFDWNWITARRSENCSLADANKLAPASWKNWVKEGPKSIDRLRRRVSRLYTLSTSEQQPETGSVEDSALQAIYKFYDGRKARFEALAAMVTSQIITNEGGQYQQGWITSSSSDGGADYYGRLDVGKGFGQAKIIVLGQAKCESLTSPTGGNHIARTIARLKRGWIGVYVTTSYFSEPVQREIIEDSYPILLINGLKLAQTVLRTIYDEGFPTVIAYLEFVDSQYDEMLSTRKPEELLFE